MRRIGIADTASAAQASADHALHTRRHRAGRPGRDGLKPVWYLPVATGLAAAGVALPVVLVYSATGQPHPFLCALTATAGWLLVQAARRRFDQRRLGESRRILPVLQDWLILLGLLALTRTVLDESSDPQIALLALLSAPVVTAAGRLLLNQHLVESRREAHAVHRVLVVGEPGAADLVVGQLAARTDHAYVAVGVVPVGEGTPTCGVPEAARLGAVAPDAPRWDAGALLGAARETGAELVLIVPGQRLSGARLRQLAWALHEAGLPLAVLPGVVEVAERRMRLSVTAGLAMVHIAPPLRRGPQLVLKTVLDRLGAALGLVLLSPLFAAIAIAVKSTSPGPVFHRQTRLGRDAEPFTMWKFRSMVRDAEEQRAELTAVNEHEGPLFKIRRDPRVTRVGELLRRSSLDELPQLINVLRGDMSLVGPRPPLPEEAARYTETERRRLAVRPGMTGLWQVSGRSDLSWDETVALDLRYVDNWSIGDDVGVLARTVRAVVDGRGAY
ncbi:sugar transferase [Streptomyces sp. NPDC051940]|uniref:sugar transferase n=1 Tax=Streptomyces sp. NPDC051940 TaxID=3155675 RepID=UPI003426C709